MRILVTGGAGYVNPAVVRILIEGASDPVVNVNELAYTSKLLSTSAIQNDSRYCFGREHISNTISINFPRKIRANASLYLAAGPHPDRSFRAAKFIQADARTCASYDATDTGGNKLNKAHVPFCLYLQQRINC